MVWQLHLALHPLLCTDVFIKVSFSVFFLTVLSQHRRVRAAFAGPGRCIVLLENEGASSLKKGNYGVLVWWWGGRRRRVRPRSWSLPFFSLLLLVNMRPGLSGTVEFNAVCWSTSLHVCMYMCLFVCVLHLFKTMYYVYISVLWFSMFLQCVCCLSKCNVIHVHSAALLVRRLCHNHSWRHFGSHFGC